MSKDSIDLLLRVRKEDIYLICPYFEAFDGMAAIRTPKPEAGEYATLKLMVSPDFTRELDAVLESLGKKVWFERILGKD